MDDDSPAVDEKKDISPLITSGHIISVRYDRMIDQQLVEIGLGELRLDTTHNSARIQYVLNGTILLSPFITYEFLILDRNNDDETKPKNIVFTGYFRRQDVTKAFLARALFLYGPIGYCNNFARCKGYVEDIFPRLAPDAHISEMSINDIRGGGGGGGFYDQYAQDFIVNIAFHGYFFSIAKREATLFFGTIFDRIRCDIDWTRFKEHLKISPFHTVGYPKQPIDMELDSTRLARLFRYPLLLDFNGQRPFFKRSLNDDNNDNDNNDDDGNHSIINQCTKDPDSGIVAFYFYKSASQKLFFKPDQSSDAFNLLTSPKKDESGSLIIPHPRHRHLFSTILNSLRLELISGFITNDCKQAILKFIESAEEISLLRDQIMKKKKPETITTTTTTNKTNTANGIGGTTLIDPTDWKGLLLEKQMYDKRIEMEKQKKTESSRDVCSAFYLVVPSKQNYIREHGIDPANVFDLSTSLDHLFSIPKPDFGCYISIVLWPAHLFNLDQLASVIGALKDSFPDKSVVLYFIGLGPKQGHKPPIEGNEVSSYWDLLRQRKNFKHIDQQTDTYFL